jgi:hypothetical protein
MATTTIVDGYVYVTTGTVSTNTITHTDVIDCVDIAVGGNIKHDIGKQSKSTPIPVPRGSWGSKLPINYIIDLKTFSQVITINGSFISDTTNTAKTKKDRFLYIVGASTTNLRGGTFTIVWGTGTNREQYTVNMTKCTIDEDSAISTDSSGNRTRMPVMAQFMVGTDR